MRGRRRDRGEEPCCRCTPPSAGARSGATATYTAATLAGIFTNSVFGADLSPSPTSRCGTSAPTPAATTSTDAVTYVWLGQAMLMTVALWGGGTTDDLAERIRTGDVAIDLYRPAGLRRLVPRRRPRPRGVPPADARARPDRSSGCSSSTSGCPTDPLDASWRSLVSRGAGGRGQLRAALRSSPRRRSGCSTPAGLRFLSGAFAIFFSGMMLPLVLFPGWLGTLARALPWAAFIQVPNDIWLGQYDGWALLGALGFQAALGRRCCSAPCAGRAARGDPQGGGAGWLSSTGRRRHRRAGRSRCGAIRHRCGSGCAPRWPTPRRSC